MTRRFTGAGFLALGTLVTAGALGIDTNQTLAYQIFTFLFALVAAAMLAALLLRPKFQVARILPRMITAGQAFDYRVLVRNLGTRPADGLVLLEDLCDPRPAFAEFRSAVKFPTYRGWWRLSMRNQVAHIDETVLPALAPRARPRCACKVSLTGAARSGSKARPSRAPTRWDCSAASRA